MPPETENSSFYVAQYQSRKNGVWSDWFQWFDTRIQAWQWIEEQIEKQQRYGTARMNYRVRCQPRVLDPSHAAKKPDVQPADSEGSG